MKKLSQSGLVCILCVVSMYAQSQNSVARIDSIVQTMSLEEKIDYIGGTGFAIRALPNLNLPALEMSDGPIGVRSNSRFPSTLYAAGIGLAASWNQKLAERIGEGIGRDARARGINFMLGPGVNIYRSPRNGRNFEYFGEDPFLAARIAVGYISGMQKQGVSVGYRGYQHNKTKPLFPFGFGLSYTSFKFANLAVKQDPDAANGIKYLVSFDVTNTGTRSGAEVAQLYISDPSPVVPRPPKELKGFVKINLTPGQTQRLTIPLEARSFAYYDVNEKQWLASPAKYKVLVGDSSDAIKLTGEIQLNKAITLKP